MSSTEISENTKLDVNGSPLRVGRFIANGASANVFRGEYKGREVAIKAMRAGAKASFGSEFKGEVHTLEEIRKQWPLFHFTTPQVVPELLAADLETEFPIILEEFVDGKRLDHAMQELDAGVFSEEQALFLALQIGKVLRILHEHLERCYGDVKFGNFLILGDSAAPEPALKMIDWNVLGYYTLHNVEKDLAKVSGYVLYMLTGTLLSVDSDTLQLEKPLSSIPAFERLTAGTRQFLERAFDPMLEHRFANMQSWLAAVGDLLALWRADSGDLMQQAPSDLARADREEDLDQYLSMLAKADILCRKQVPGADALFRRVHDAASGEVVVTRMIEKLWGPLHDVEGCISEFENARKRLQYRTNEQIMIWGWVARAAQEIGQDRYYQHDDLRSATQARLAGNFAAAYDGYAISVSAFPGVRPLQELKAESHVLLLLSEAAQAKPSDEASLQIILTKYQQACDMANQVPAELQQVSIARKDIEAQLRKAQTNVADFKAAEQNWEAAIKMKDAPSEFEKIGQALDTTPIPSLIVERLREQAMSALESRSFSQAVQLASVPAQHGHDNEWFANVRRTTARLSVVFSELDRLPVGKQALERLLMYVDELEGRTGEPTLAFPSPVLKSLAASLQRVDPNMLTQQELEVLRHRLQPLTPQVLSMHAPLATEVEKVDMIARERELKRAPMQAKTGKLLAHMEATRQHIEVWSNIESELGSESSPIVQQERTILLLSLVEDLCELRRRDPLQESLARFDDFLTSQGLRRWVDVQGYIKMLVDRGATGYSTVIEECLENGKLDEAGVFLEALGEAARFDLRERFQMIQQFLQWAGNLPKEEDTAEAKLKQSEIPLLYWQFPQTGQPSAAEYFKAKSDSIRAAFTIDRLPALARYWWIYQRASGNPAPQPRSDWAAVERAARDLSKANTSSHASAEKVLFDSIAALPSPEQIKTQAPRSHALLKILGSVAVGVMLVVVGLAAAVAIFRFKPPVTLVAPASPVTLAAPATSLPAKTAVSETNAPTGGRAAKPPTTATENPQSGKNQYPPQGPGTLQSKYVWPAGAPALPKGVEPLYLMSGSNGITYTPENANVWFVPDHPAGIGSQLRYANQTTKNASVDWKMDAPVPSDGLYAFYANDTKVNSATNQPVMYSLFVNDETAPRKLDFGDNRIRQLSSEVQTTDEWRCIGMYFLKAGETPRIHVDVPELKDKEMFGVDAVAIASVKDVTATMRQHIAQQGLLYWADDSEAQFKPATGWSNIDDSATWLGGHKIDVTGGKLASVVWTFPERLPPGNYQVAIFLPNELTTNVKVSVNTFYSSSGNKVEVATATFPTDSGVGGTFQLIGDRFTILEKHGPDGLLSRDSQVFVMVTIKSTGQSGVFAYDNVILMRVP